jgi:mono/diheme cytochrome c family protein
MALLISKQILVKRRQIWQGHRLEARKKLGVSLGGPEPLVQQRRGPNAQINLMNVSKDTSFVEAGAGSLPKPACLAAVLAIASWAVAPPPLAAAAAAIQFNRDIRPILSENCFACHGPDEKARKGKFRLDTREGLFEPRPKHKPAVVPGKPAESELWRRVTATDPDDVMPPPDSHKTLKPEQKELIRKWIVAGAPWQGHWAFVKPDRPPLPRVKDRAWVRNPIDAFILAQLEARGLKPAPEADRRTLARRLALDLTGLPPTPEEVEAFVKDRAPDYYERHVQTLMDSPPWGEHRARYWLDAARYADTHGLHFDNYREMWPYRDWVIKAFNANVRFNQFTLEQIAGDLLPNPDDDQLVATGFHRCNMTTNEGGTIEEENLCNYANDRVTTTAWVWLGLTANCAACHDHKFDPITQRDFYSMAAFFRNTTQPGLDGNVKDSKPSLVVVQSEEDRKRWKALPGEIETAKTTVEQRRQEGEAAFAQWIAGLKSEDVERELSAKDLAAHIPLADGQTNEIVARLAGIEKRRAPVGSVTLKSSGKLGPALVFPKGATVEFPEVGDFDHSQPFSCGAWVFLPKDYSESASILARMDEKNEHRGWDLWHQGGQFAVHLVHKWPDHALKVRTAKRVAKKGQWQHLLVTWDGSGRPEGVKIYVDGAAAATEVEVNKPITGGIRTRVPFKLLQRSQGAHLDGGSVQDVRVYARALAAPEVTALAHFSQLRALLGTPVAEWKKESRDELFDYFLSTRHAPFQKAQQALAALEQEREGIRLRHPVTHVQQEKKDTMPVANILFRGAYDKPKEKVEANTFAVLHRMPEGAPRNRLGLAQWLVAPDNPLSARVTVNRFWAEVFGVGLVKTAEDFGTMGERPVNPSLLDWLAVEFLESGWDVKHLFKLMVTSAAYRQSAAVTPEKLEKDPQNRLLSRGPRFRMDAEMVRDYALATSGLLVKKIGGPSVKPYQPDGVWEAVAMPESNTRKYKRDTGEALYRRSLYTFWKRAAPPATMDILNAPNREVCTVRRERTNTPLQALATLNDPNFVEAARHLAQTALRQGEGSFDRALAFAASRVLLRPLRPQETAVVKATHAKLLAFYEQQPEEARKFLAVGEAQADESLPAPPLAAMTMVANQLLNLDEVLNK